MSEHLCNAEDTFVIPELSQNRNHQNLLAVGRPVGRQRSASTPELDDGKLYGLRKRAPSSCQALRHAVLTLYRMDDFNMEILGNGFFSDVYKVTHKVTGEVMVLKMNTFDGNKSNVLREVQLMNKMAHTNILKFLGVCVDQGQLHALSEFINGGSLHEILANEAEVLSWQERVQISLDIASGMKYLHHEGVFHRDLTSRNVLIKIDGAAKVAIVGDFGLATKIPNKDEEFRLSTVGTPYWMSPECIKGQIYDERSDIFSFGIILCEIIARIDADPDFMPRTQNFGLDYIAFSALTPDCPLHYLYLAFRCCQMDPARRPVFHEIVECLEDIKERRLPSLHENPIAARSNITAGHVKRFIRRFNKQEMGHKRSRSAGQHLDFLQTASQIPGQPTAQFIGEHMTVEDPFYKPATESVNPFEYNLTVRGCRKILASEAEDIDLSMPFPLSTEFHVDKTKRPLSLPADCSKIYLDKARDDLSHQIDKRRVRDKLLPIPWVLDTDDDQVSVDSAFDTSSQLSNNSKLLSPTSDHNKQLNLECAMLFCGLDLIQISKSKTCDTNPNDLESEFQDDLEDVLRSCSSSESWMSVDDYALSPPLNSEMEQQWWEHVDKNDPACRYFHPTLVEKRRTLRRVDTRNRDKLEQLQIKLDRLRVQTSRKHKAVKT